MTSILFLIDTIDHNIFRCNYVTNKKVFVNFFVRFRNLDPIFKIFKKKMTHIADLFLNLRNPINLVR